MVSPPSRAAGYGRVTRPLRSGHHFEGADLQRYFSSFPTGVPGLGLLLLRVAVGVGAGLLPVVQAFAARGPHTWASLVACVLGAMLVLGLLTPVSGLGLAAIGLAVSTGAHASMSGVDGVLGAATALAVALLGPGAYSLDARLFGRREIVVSHAPRR